MRVSVPCAAPTSNNNNTNTATKPTTTTSTPLTTSTTTTTTLSYEPTSVLDLQRSPSPTTNPTDALSTTTLHPPVDLDNLEGWDSILSELGLNDDSSTTPPHPKFHLDPPPLPHDFPHPHHPDFSDPFPFPQFPPQLDDPKISGYGYNYSTTNNTNNNNNNIEYLIDDLIRTAQSFESNDTAHAQQILSRLHPRLRSPSGKPLHRAAFYFKEALSRLLTGPASSPPRPLSSYDVVQTIRAYKSLSGVSPIPLFSTFTANQAILEAIDGSNFIHLIDFDIGFGGHWASLMREIADNHKSDLKSGHQSIVIRITAIVPDEFGVESKLVRENLAQFARELNITFHMEFVLLRSFEVLSFKTVKFMQGEKVAVHLCASVVVSVPRILGDLRGVAAHVVVVVDKEVGMETGTASFSLNFVAGLEFYTAVLESVEAAVAGGEAGRRIENYLVRPRIVEAVEGAAGRRGAAAAAGVGSWREAFAAAGIKAVGFSQFADFQAEGLLRRAQVAGFHVAKRQGEMLLCWHDRPLVATSAWRC